MIYFALNFTLYPLELGDILLGLDMTRILSMIAGIVMLAPALVFAQSGDAEAGKAKIATCAACHGQNGVGTAPENPSLAGQVPGYIAAQLKLFKMGAEGGRENVIMGGMVATLTEQDMADIDAYYSSLPPHNGSITPEQEETALAGRTVYRAGYAEFNIPACMGCHGPTGSGISPHYPRISGLSKEYLQSQLKAYKTGQRKNEMMNAISHPLTAQQIEELATYISGLN